MSDERQDHRIEAAMGRSELRSLLHEEVQCVFLLQRDLMNTVEKTMQKTTIFKNGSEMFAKLLLPCQVLLSVV